MEGIGELRTGNPRVFRISKIFSNIFNIVIVKVNIFMIIYVTHIMGGTRSPGAGEPGAGEPRTRELGTRTPRAEPTRAEIPRRKRARGKTRMGRSPGGSAVV